MILQVLDQVINNKLESTHTKYDERLFFLGVSVRLQQLSWKKKYISYAP